MLRSARLIDHGTPRAHPGHLLAGEPHMRLAEFWRTSLPTRESITRQLQLISMACSGILQNLSGDELAGDVQIVARQQSSSQKKVPGSVERLPNRAEVVVFKNHVPPTR
jgi:hypothetical protein